MELPKTTAFENLKNIWEKKIKLAIFESEGGKIRVKTDASKIGIGAVLEQLKDNSFKFIALFSRRLLEREQKYIVGEREALTCVEAIEYFHLYIAGRNFELLTDHRALVSLLSNTTSRRINHRSQRWKMRLNRYKFTIRYINGKANSVADTLSRLTGTESETTKVNSIKSTNIDSERNYKALIETIQENSWTGTGEMNSSEEMRKYLKQF